jgi:hypothetical protein
MDVEIVTDITVFLNVFKNQAGASGDAYDIVCR